MDTNQTAIAAKMDVEDSASVASVTASYDDISELYDGGRERTQTMTGHVIQCSQVPVLKKGVNVTILRTENVVQRAPHLVGKQAIIKEAPVHPATWFKVEFCFGKNFGHSQGCEY